METNDWSLLQEYATGKSEAAFRALVERYAGLVYHAALRRSGNPHAAEEIAQAVFIALARKAGGIPRRASLAGWLYQAARFAGSNLAREAASRQRHEQEAVIMETTLAPAEAESVWQQISPRLYEALDQLSSRDRDALLIRFFEGKSHRELALALGVSEEAARTRVSRAVERLRSIFARRGIAAPTAALTAALAAHGAQAAPAGLAASITAAALAGGASGAVSTLATAEGILKLMAWSKLKTTLLTGAVLLFGAATTGIVILKTANPAKLGRFGGAPAVVDRTTPKGTLFVMARAMADGDVQTYLDCFLFTTAEELKLKGALADLVAANARFQKAAAARFGADAARAVFGRQPFVMPPDFLATGKETIDGDSAGVAFGGKLGRPMELTKVGGEWKLKAGRFLNLPPLALSDMCARVAKTMNDASAGISQNQFQTPLEAIEKAKTDAE